MAFEKLIRNRILYMTLNTPGSSVNIFDHHASAQITETMEAIENSTEIDAVVFRSSKPGSFINGAQLMFASAIQSKADALRLSGGVRQAYQSIKRSSKLTVAAIQ